MDILCLMPHVHVFISWLSWAWRKTHTFVLLISHASCIVYYTGMCMLRDNALTSVLLYLHVSAVNNRNIILSGDSYAMAFAIISEFNINWPSILDKFNYDAGIYIEKLVILANKCVFAKENEVEKPLVHNMLSQTEWYIDRCRYTRVWIICTQVWSGPKSLGQSRWMWVNADRFWRSGLNVDLHFIEAKPF